MVRRGVLARAPTDRESDSRPQRPLDATTRQVGRVELTTTGRRSGRPRSVIIGYYEDGPNLVSMAMNGWGADEPAWWMNLQADPHAVVELPGGKQREVLCRAAHGEERDRLWERWRELDENLDDYARPTSTRDGGRRPRAAWASRGPGHAAGCNE